MTIKNLISTVISFSSLETRFFDALVKETEKFCNDIIVVYYDHFFDGSSEDLKKIEELKSRHGNLTWIMWNWSDSNDSRYWHNNARWVGAERAQHGRVLFLDGDEIPDGDLMLSWLNTEPLDSYSLYIFKCYWYFREPQYQAKTTEMCGLLADMSKVKKEMLFTQNERWFHQNYPISYKALCTFNGSIIFNHYSWVRTKEEMLKKVRSWAHRNDCPWVDLVEKEFAHELRILT